MIGSKESIQFNNERVENKSFDIRATAGAANLVGPGNLQHNNYSNLAFKQYNSFIYENDSNLPANDSKTCMN